MGLVTKDGKDHPLPAIVCFDKFDTSYSSNSKPVYYKLLLDAIP